MLHNIYEGDKIGIELVEYAAHMAEMINTYNIFSRMKGTDHVGDTRIRDKIVLTMYLKQVWCVKIKWIQLAHDRFQ
jgi:hypothetical protein